VLSAREAEAIGETRIGGVRLKDLAAEWEVPYGQLKRFRQHAEVRLVAWLRFDRLRPGGPSNRVS
jgi:hypothetical protein